MRPGTDLEFIVDMEIPTLVASEGEVQARLTGTSLTKPRFYKLAHSYSSESRAPSPELGYKSFGDNADDRTIKPAAGRDQIRRREAYP